MYSGKIYQVNVEQLWVVGKPAFVYIHPAGYAAAC